VEHTAVEEYLEFDLDVVRCLQCLKARFLALDWQKDLELSVHQGCLLLSLLPGDQVLDPKLVVRDCQPQRSQDSLDLLVHQDFDLLLDSLLLDLTLALMLELLDSPPHLTLVMQLLVLLQLRQK
jgi:hypothetical protein